MSIATDAKHRLWAEAYVYLGALLQQRGVTRTRRPGGICLRRAHRFWIAMTVDYEHKWPVTDLPRKIYR